MSLEDEKRLVGEAAAQLVTPGMRVGLGTGTTVHYLLIALARLAPQAVFFATSPETEAAALALGLNVEPFDTVSELDLAIDGADQIAPDWWLVKGRGGAHTREKIVAASAERFVVIADSSKPVDHLHAPVPLELEAFGIEATLARVAPAALRDAPPSPDGGLIGDYLGEVTNPRALAERLSLTPGVVGHGLFPPEMVSDVLVGAGKTVVSPVPRGGR